LARLPRFPYLHPSREDKTERWKYKDNSIREREANIQEFAHLTGKPYIEHYTTADMLRYKEHLYTLGRANDTVLNKLSCIVTWLKRDGLVSTVGLLPADERPARRETGGHPFSETGDKIMKLVTRHTFERGDGIPHPRHWHARSQLIKVREATGY
jgi:hypothetical protein